MMDRSDYFEPSNGLASDDRKDLGARLGRILDAVYSLMVRTHVYHRNVEGPLFEPVHKLTEAQYTFMFAAVDEIAERIRALDVKPAVNLNVFPTGVANLPEAQNATNMMADLINHHDTVIRDMRAVVSAANVVQDVVTADLLTGYIAQHEKDTWMLRAMLRGS